MASPAIAIPNGGPAPMQLNNNNAVNSSNNHTNTNTNTIDITDMSTAQSVAGTSIKRKREPTDVGEKPPNGITVNRITPTAHNAVSSSVNKVDQPTIRNYYEVLQRFDPIPSVLKRPLPHPNDSPDEPQAKRKKSDAESLPSIADKVSREQYDNLDSIISDIKTSITDHLAELRDIQPGEDAKANDEAIAKIIDFKRQAYSVFKREMTYNNARVSDVLRDLESISDLQSNAGGNIVLTVTNEAMREGKQLYSSLQQAVAKPGSAEVAIRPLRENGLPLGIKTARVIPYSFQSAVEKDKKAKTLGELFPAPRNLPSLQPPKAPKSTTKGVQVGWHRPELTEKFKYRANAYSGLTISAGRWLDYSNAAPPSQIMTKQRERALSLAGNKPSSSDLEMSEMEALFRGAFSSFAPTKDDSAAMISSGVISHTMWWQKVGKRSFERLAEVELPEDTPEDADKSNDVPVEEVDEALIKEALDNWDETMVDPSLEQVCCPKKSDEEKDVDDILQEVSDMIQTLVSYQKNRNLTLPSASSQSRYAADPAHSDMLTNGTPVQPGEEEMATYQALKAQLSLIIQMLPPYAVARINSDQLGELNISTKIEVRTDEYQGLMEEDEIARARAAQAATANPRPSRSTSSSNNLQYGQQFHTSRAPMPAQPYYSPQTPVRAQQPTIQRPQQSLPAAYPQRPSSNTGYRPPNHYANTGYQQFPKQQPYSQPSPGYGNTPTQGRPQYQSIPGYPNVNSATPQARYPSYTPNAQAPNYHHLPPYQAQHQPAPHGAHGTPSHASYAQYTNGTGAAPARTASPHVPHQQPHPQHQHQPIPHHPGYNPAAAAARPSSYGNQPNVGNDPSRPFYPAAGSPAIQNNQLAHHGQQNQNPPTPGTSSFHTSLSSHQVQQAMNQAKARFEAKTTAKKTNEGIRNSTSGQSQGQVGAPVGLGGIGLGGAVRQGVPNYQVSTQSPKPQHNSPQVSAGSPTYNENPAMVPAPPMANGGQPVLSRKA
ncbi:hypothetical protein F4677DRAFT_458727 [Hypoxylon crocopeplum]|nr:hypothetical protein F4677DRAFT_458727 [Hypoxylon crocopeplum]